MNKSSKKLVLILPALLKRTKLWLRAQAVGLDAAAFEAGDAATFGASKVPNFSGSIAFGGSLALSTPTMDATVQIGGGVSGSLPLGSAATGVAAGFVKFGNVLNFYNAGATTVMAIVCAN